MITVLRFGVEPTLAVSELRRWAQVRSRYFRRALYEWQHDFVVQPVALMVDSHRRRAAAFPPRFIRKTPARSAGCVVSTTMTKMGGGRRRSVEY